MKLNTQKKSVQSGGINIKVNMKIDMNGKSFSTLSSGIYSHVIPTVVRELSSNAYDAHIANGTPDLPFSVGCPNVFDPHFTVTDWGTGLRYFKYNALIINEHDGESTIFIEGDIRDEIKNIDVLVMNGDTTLDVGALLYDTKKDETVIRIAGNYEGTEIEVEFDDTLVLYSTYFRSTKEDSNDFVGAFGLGSKTPLAYTDNFFVTNRYEGTKRVYNIATNEDNEPQIALMFSEATDEANGLEVKLAVDPDDYQEFKEAIASELMGFDPLPEVLNEKVDFPEVTHKGENFWIVEGLGSTGGGYWDRKAHAMVGNNSYQIQKVESDLFKTGNLVLRLKVGEVMVTTSREELKYEEDTIRVIRQREADALEEYTKYVMDSIDDTGMTDYEKADFLNKNHSVISLESKDVQAKVGNPHYVYRSNAIYIPISGWGDTTQLHWETQDVLDEDGLVIDQEVTGVNQYRSYNQSALKWSTYSRGATKSQKVSGDQWISPKEKILVFVRDNSFSFLKKINHYLSNNEDDRDRKVLILDMFSGDQSADGFECMKSLVGHIAKFVTLSSITLPKTISTTPYDRCTTPTARMYNQGDRFHASKYWTPVYTPLTKIETEGSYVIQSHIGNIETMSDADESFLHAYFNSGLDVIDNEQVTILVLGRAKYAKALTYGFKPVKKLIKRIKKNLVIPVDLVNNEALEDTVYEIQNNHIVSLFEDVIGQSTVELDKSSPVAKLIRINKLYNKRYKRADENPVNDLVSYVKEKHLPKASDFVQKTIDSVKEMLYTVDTDLMLVNEMTSWEVTRHDGKRESLVKYANAIFNTGEVK